MPQHHESQAALAGLRVLVVEDMHLVAIALCEMLRSVGCVPIGPAASVDEAMGLLCAQSVDAALLDVNLGRETSAALLKPLRREDAAVVIVTAYDNAREFLPLEGEEVVLKPPETDELAAALTRALERHQGNGEAIH